MNAAAVPKQSPAGGRSGYNSHYDNNLQPISALIREPELPPRS
jgi:hypothetical protein